MLIQSPYSKLSYSSLLTLHSCPRKFQLYKLQVGGAEDSESDSLTFAFGHLVGDGIQLALKGLTEDQVVWKLFLSWKPDLLSNNEKQKKSFFLGIFAVQKFILTLESSLLYGYDLVYIPYTDSENGKESVKPACELSFKILFPDGFEFRGHVDAVLQHKTTKKILVLEVKTTSSASINIAQYKNSAQAVGYSVVLDHIFPELSSYDVLYLPYKTKTLEYEPLLFTKSYLQRALWIQELLLDIETIRLYETTGVFPMRGESCFQWYRECEYFTVCTLKTEYLTQPPQKESEKEPKKEPVYDYTLHIKDLISSQLSRV